MKHFEDLAIITCEADSAKKVDEMVNALRQKVDVRFVQTHVMPIDDKGRKCLYNYVVFYKEKSAEEPEDDMACPKCNKKISSKYTSHFACGWRKDGGKAN